MSKFKNLKRYVALKIRVDFETGERAGDIDPRDPGLYCLAQNLDDGYEIRLVLDDRDISVYQNVEGIEIIKGIKNIDSAILNLLPNEEQHLFVQNDSLLQASIIAKHQDPNDSFSINDIPNDTTILDIKENGVYINGEKIFGKKVADKLSAKFGKSPPFKITLVQLQLETRDKIIKVWLMKKGVKGIKMVRRVKKLSELI